MKIAFSSLSCSILLLLSHSGIAAANDNSPLCRGQDGASAEDVGSSSCVDAASANTDAAASSSSRFDSDDDEATRKEAGRRILEVYFKSMTVAAAAAEDNKKNADQETDDDRGSGDEIEDDRSLSYYDADRILSDAQIAFGTWFTPTELRDMMDQSMQGVGREEKEGAATAKEKGGDAGPSTRKKSKKGGGKKMAAADKYIQGLLNAADDPDCMSREFDVSDATFKPNDAIDVMQKCKLLVLRNVFNLTFLEEYRSNFTNYIEGISSGDISSAGTTTHGEDYYVHEIDHHRWDIVLPHQMAHESIVANPALLEVLKNDAILGPSMTLLSLGTAMGGAGANAQRWHKDDDYLFGQTSLDTHGFAGHDLPSYAVTMMVPLLNVTVHHGPTEFCMGTSYLDGFDVMPPFKPSMQNASLRQRLYDDFMEWNDDVEENMDVCPPKYWRRPVLNLGDVILFDYQLAHRGGRNVSPDLRAVMYMTYSRPWYRDNNFNDYYSTYDFDEFFTERYDIRKNIGKKKREVARRLQLERLTNATRFAIPQSVSCSHDNDEDKEEKTIDTCWNFTPKRNLEEIGSFSPHNFERQEDLYSDEDDDASFVVSNKDINVEGLQMLLDGEAVGALDKGTSLYVEAEVGDVAELQGPKGEVVQSWTVVSGHQQVVATEIS